MARRPSDRHGLHRDQKIPTKSYRLGQFHVKKRIRILDRMIMHWCLAGHSIILKSELDVGQERKHRFETFPVFPNAACVVSLVDRLVHNAEIIQIEGESYRLKEATERSETQHAFLVPSAKYQ